ncbi:MAG: NAD(P)H-dependent glycerol-3-phosphate dehydrogenase, partial [Patescibacteria group bacterium]
GIVGAGRWGCTLAALLSKVGHEVHLVGTDEDLDLLNTTGRVPCGADIKLPKTIHLKTTNESIRDFPVVFVAVSGEFLEKAYYQQTTSGILVVACKALYNSSDAELVLPTQLLNHPDYEVYFTCAGFPEGLLRGSPSIGTAYSLDPKNAQIVQELFPSKILRVYTSEDIIGGQIGAALKNIVALASGIAMQMRFDTMTRASLISRGAAEITKVGLEIGADLKTFSAGTTFMADLVGTCLSCHSRNVHAGILLAGGYNRQETELQLGTVEGFHTLEALASTDFLKMMPIASAVQSIIEGEKPQNALEALLSRPLTNE